MSAAREIVSALIAGGMDPADAAALMAQAALEIAQPSTTKSAGALRQQRYRERHKASQSVTPLRSDRASQNVTERNESVTRDAAPLSLEEESKKIRKEKREANRGHRLPDDWAPTAQDLATADELIGIERRRDELAKFRDHWKQQPGSKGVKLDWDAAWRNWIRRAAEFRGGTNGQRSFNPSRRSSSSDFFAGIASVAADIAGHGEPSGYADEEIPSGRVNIDG